MSKTEIWVGSMIGVPLMLSLSAGAVAQTSKPSDQLRYFDGAWHCDGVFPSTGKKIVSSVVFEWFPNTGGLVKHHEDEQPNKYSAVELWVASKVGFQALVGDSFGGARSFSSVGWVGQSLTWIGTADSADKDSFVYTKLGSKKMRIDWMVSKSGAADVVGDTLTCIKADS